MEENVHEFLKPELNPVPNNRDSFRQMKKKDISDKEIDENVYEFVVPNVDPVTKNRVLGVGPKTQFDTPPAFA